MQISKISRFVFSLCLFVFLIYDMQSPVLFDESVLHYLNPEMKSFNYVPNNPDDYTQDTPAKVITLVSLYENTGLEPRDYNTHIIYKNIFDRKIKVTKVVLTFCDANSYNFSQKLNKTSNRVITTQTSENSSIDVDMVLGVKKFVNVPTGSFERIKLNIDYKSFLNLEPSYSPASQLTYWCHFDLYDGDEKLYEVTSSPLSNNFDMMHSTYIQSIVQLV